MYRQIILKLILALSIIGVPMCSFAIYESQALNQDTFENYNRNAYRMNDTLDKNFIRPTTVFYTKYIPDPLRSVIQNFFNNLRDFVTLGNDVLQLSGEAAMHNVMRIAINSTFGILGAIDISTNVGLPQHINTFGKTLKVYGWKHSSYFVIPILGPSTVRDTIGMVPDVVFNPTWWIIPQQYNYVSVGLFAVNGIDQRAKYLDFDQVLDTSLDPYETMRDTYLQSQGESIPQNIHSGSNDVDIDSLIEDKPTK